MQPQRFTNWQRPEIDRLALKPGTEGNPRDEGADVSENENKVILSKIDKKLDRLLEHSREIKTAVATASTQVVGAGEAVHAIAHRIELDAIKSEQDSRDTGAHQNRLATTQEELALWQLGNAKLTRILLVTGIIGTIVSGTMVVLGFLKWYVHQP